MSDCLLVTQWAAEDENDVLSNIGRWSMFLNVHMLNTLKKVVFASLFASSKLFKTSKE